MIINRCSKSGFCRTSSSDVSSFFKNLVAVTRVQTLKLDQDNYPSEEFFKDDRTTGKFVLKTDRSHYSEVNLRLNEGNMYDGFLSMHISSSKVFWLDFFSASDYTFSKTSTTPLLQQDFGVTSTGLRHHRKPFSIWGFFAYIGGIVSILMILFNWCVGPFARHGFLVRAMKRLYYARTPDKRLLQERSEDNYRYRRQFEELMYD